MRPSSVNKNRFTDLCVRSLSSVRFFIKDFVEQTSFFTVVYFPENIPVFLFLHSVLFLSLCGRCPAAVCLSQTL